MSMKTKRFKERQLTLIEKKKKKASEQDDIDDYSFGKKSEENSADFEDNSNFELVDNIFKKTCKSVFSHGHDAMTNLYN